MVKVLLIIFLRDTNKELIVKLTYGGYYRYGLTVTLTLTQQIGLTYKLDGCEYFFRNINRGDLIFSGHDKDQVFAIYFSLSSLEDIKVGDNIQGYYISINPVDNGEINCTQQNKYIFLEIYIYI